MAATKNYQVKAPACYITRTDGSAVLLYGGAPVPDDAVPDDVKRLLAEEFIVEVDGPTGGLQADYDGQVVGTPVSDEAPRKSAAAKA